MALLLLLVSCAQTHELMPTPRLHTLNTADPFASVPAALRTDTVDVLYVTDRRPETDDEGTIEYGHERSESLTFGSVVVGIGDSPGWEVLVRESRTNEREDDLDLEIRSITELGSFPATPALRSEVATGAERRAANRLQAEIRRRLALTPKKEAFVYIHGFAATFEKGAFRAAELWHFMGRQGVPITYSWPAGSKSMLFGYPRDSESAQFTVFHLKQFLRTLGSCPGIDRVNILAHSRGAAVASTALRELLLEERGAGRTLRDRLRIGNVVLAAPDLDYEVALQQLCAERLSESIGRLTIYTSRSDQAIGLADWLMGSESRVGRMDLEHLSTRHRKLLAELPRLQIVEFAAESPVFGHRYYRLSPLASSDIILLLRDNRPPGAENGRPLKFVAQGYWILTDDYLSD